MKPHYVSSKPAYSALANLATQSIAASWPDQLHKKIIPYCIDQWLNHYDLAETGGEVVEVSSQGFFYLFDLGPDRLIAAWGVSQGRVGADRDKSRMQGYPLGASTSYHRGHAIPHRLGSGTDINLAAQLGSVNIGPFRALEKRAVSTPGSLYFTYWMYWADSRRQVASKIQQGLVSYGTPPDIGVFNN